MAPALKMRALLDRMPTPHEMLGQALTAKVTTETRLRKFLQWHFSEVAEFLSHNPIFRKLQEIVKSRKIHGEQFFIDFVNSQAWPPWSNVLSREAKKKLQALVEELQTFLGGPKGILLNGSSRRRRLEDRNRRGSKIETLGRSRPASAPRSENSSVSTLDTRSKQLIASQLRTPPCPRRRSVDLGAHVVARRYQATRPSLDTEKTIWSPSKRRMSLDACAQGPLDRFVVRRDSTSADDDDNCASGTSRRRCSGTRVRTSGRTLIDIHRDRASRRERRGLVDSPFAHSARRRQARDVKRSKLQTAPLTEVVVLSFSSGSQSVKVSKRAARLCELLVTRRKPGLRRWSLRAPVSLDPTGDSTGASPTALSPPPAEAADQQTLLAHESTVTSGSPYKGSSVILPVTVTFQKQPKRLGRINILVVPKSQSRPTLKVLHSLSTGAFIVTEDFLESTAANQAWPVVDKFEHPSFPTALTRRTKVAPGRPPPSGARRPLLQAPVELRHVFARPPGTGLFSGIVAYLVGEFKPPCIPKSNLESLISDAGGAVGKSSKSITELLQPGRYSTSDASQEFGDQPGSMNIEIVVVSEGLSIRDLQMLRTLLEDQQQHQPQNPQPEAATVNGSGLVQSQRAPAGDASGVGRARPEQQATRPAETAEMDDVIMMPSSADGQLPAAATMPIDETSAVTAQAAANPSDSSVRCIPTPRPLPRSSARRETAPRAAIQWWREFCGQRPPFVTVLWLVECLCQWRLCPPQQFEPVVCRGLLGRRLRAPPLQSLDDNVPHKRRRVAEASPALTARPVEHLALAAGEQGQAAPAALTAASPSHKAQNPGRPRRLGAKTLSRRGKAPLPVAESDYASHEEVVQPLAIEAKPLSATQSELVGRNSTERRSNAEPFEGAEEHSKLRHPPRPSVQVGESGRAQQEFRTRRDGTAQRIGCSTCQVAGQSNLDDDTAPPEPAGSTATTCRTTCRTTEPSFVEIHQATHHVDEDDDEGDSHGDEEPEGALSGDDECNIGEGEETVEWAVDKWLATQQSQQSQQPLEMPEELATAQDDDGGAKGKLAAAAEDELVETVRRRRRKPVLHPFDFTQLDSPEECGSSDGDEVMLGKENAKPPPQDCESSNGRTGPKRSGAPAAITAGDVLQRRRPTRGRGRCIK